MYPGVLFPVPVCHSPSHCSLPHPTVLFPIQLSYFLSPSRSIIPIPVHYSPSWCPVPLSHGYSPSQCFFSPSQWVIPYPSAPLCPMPMVIPHPAGYSPSSCVIPRPGGVFPFLLRYSPTPWVISQPVCVISRPEGYSPRYFPGALFLVRYSPA